MTRLRKVPLRICIGCRESKSKKSLIRVVCTPEGHIEIDLTGKKSGRGAYICPKRECLNKACKGKRLEKNLKKPIPPEVIEKINFTLDELDNKNNY